MKTQFDTAAERDRKAAEYFNSNEFFKLMQDTAKGIVSSRERDRVTSRAMLPDFLVKKQDMPLVEKAFERLQQEYPQLDHIRRNKGLAAAFGRCMGMYAWSVRDVLILDTKKNGALRRLRGGLSTSTAKLPNKGGIGMEMHYGY